MPDDPRQTLQPHQTPGIPRQEATVPAEDTNNTQYQRAVSTHADVDGVEFVLGDVAEYMSGAEPFDAADAIGTLAGAFPTGRRASPAGLAAAGPRSPTRPSASERSCSADRASCWAGTTAARPNCPAAVWRPGNPSKPR